MKKIYYYVLMAASLLVGTNAWATDPLTLGNEASGATYQTLQAAIDAAEAGKTTTINLISNLSTAATAWIGTTNVTDDAKSIVLDLKGNTYTFTGEGTGIAIAHGSLDIKSSDGEGLITSSTAGELIHLYGTYQEINAKTAAPFAGLVVRQGVTVQNTNQTVIAIQEMKATIPTNFGKDAVTYHSNFFSSGSYGLANGVKVEIFGKLSAQKYGIKVNGTVRYIKDYIKDRATSSDPYEFKDNALKLINNLEPKYNGGSNDGTYTVTSDKGEFSPYIHIANTGVVRSADNSNKAIAVYASGFARWLIEGECAGANGVYAKSGDIELNDATVKSTWEGDAVLTTGQSSGVTSAGNAIVVESNASYSGGQVLTVSGDSEISSQAENGAALVEVVDPKAGVTKVDSIVINSGALTADQAIIISEMTTDDEEAIVVVYGSNIEGEISVGESTGSDALNEILSDQCLLTEIVDPSTGQTTLIVTDAGADSELYNDLSWSQIENITDGGSAIWTVQEAGVLGNGVDETKLTLTLFQMNAGTDAEHLQQLTIKKNATLEATRVVMNDFARIIVEPGGKLIVTGQQGFYAPSTDNIILQTNGTDQARLLLSPNTTSGRHPSATVQFQTKSYYKSGSDYAFERFGIPTWVAPKSFTCREDVRTRVWVYAEDGSGWQDLSSGTKDGKPDFQPSDASKLNTPFAGYNLMAYNENPGLIYTIKGELNGNGNKDLHVNMYWTSFANSYLADIDIVEFLKGFPNSNIDPTVYMATPTDVPGTYVWDAYNETQYAFDLLNELDRTIVPMRAFILKNPGAMSRYVPTNYEQAVWNPATTAAPAPARNIAFADLTGLKLVVTGENGIYDNVTLAESSNYSTEYEGGRDAEKYMNDDVNIYAHGEMNQAILATDNLENTYVGFSTVSGGNFTISFKNVMGREFDLIDLDANVTIPVKEGRTYNFTVAENTNADYRFKLVGSKKTPTAIEDIDADKKGTGIYTIMGQYVGEMNLLNTLPAGVYVVDGKKIVK